MEEIRKIAGKLSQRANHVKYEQEKLAKAEAELEQLKNQVRVEASWLLLPVIILDLNPRVTKLVTERYNFVYEIVNNLENYYTRPEGFGSKAVEDIKAALKKLQAEQEAQP